MTDVTKTCKACGSENIRVDATLKWDTHAQDWLVAKTLGAMICIDCGSEDGYVCTPAHGGRKAKLSRPSEPKGYLPGTVMFSSESVGDPWRWEFIGAQGYRLTSAGHTGFKEAKQDFFNTGGSLG